MKLTCDICDGELEMKAGGQGAVCTNCGMNYPVERLKEKIGQCQQTQPGKAPIKRSPLPETGFRMTVENVFPIAGMGIAATGTVESGSVSVGSKVLVNGSKACNVKWIECKKKMVNQAQAGMLVGLLLTNIRKEEIARGDILTCPAETPASLPEENIIYDVTEWTPLDPDGSQ